MVCLSMNFDRKNLDDNTLLKLYKHLLKPRMIEEKILILLRQGKIGKWFSGIGQEAIAVGTTLAMRFCIDPIIKIAGFGYEQNPCFLL